MNEMPHDEQATPTPTPTPEATPTPEGAPAPPDARLLHDEQFRDAYVRTLVTMNLRGVEFASESARSDFVAKLGKMCTVAPAAAPGATPEVRLGGLPVPEVIRSHIEAQENAHYFQRLPVSLPTQAYAPPALPTTPATAPQGWFVPQTEGEKNYAEWIAQHQALYAAGASPGIGLGHPTPPAWAFAGPQPQAPPTPQAPPPGWVVPQTEGERNYATWLAQRSMQPNAIGIPTAHWLQEQVNRRK